MLLLSNDALVNPVTNMRNMHCRFFFVTYLFSGGMNFEYLLSPKQSNMLLARENLAVDRAPIMGPGRDQYLRAFSNYDKPFSERRCVACEDLRQACPVTRLN